MGPHNIFNAYNDGGKGPLPMTSDQGGIVTEGSTGPAFIFSCPIPYR